MLVLINAWLNSSCVRGELPCDSSSTASSGTEVKEHRAAKASTSTEAQGRELCKYQAALPKPNTGNSERSCPQHKGSSMEASLVFLLLGFCPVLMFLRDLGELFSQQVIQNGTARWDS